MISMFHNAKAFKDKDLSRWNVGKVPKGTHYYFMTGGGSGNTEPIWKVPTKHNGYFMYSKTGVVKGLTYRTDNGFSGPTDNKGTFRYNSDSKYITFSVGDLIIKKDLNVSNLNGKIFLSDITGVQEGNTTDPYLVKLLRLLHTLDNDGNANNGINISFETIQAINNNIGGSQNLEDKSFKIKSIIDKLGKKVVNTSKARRHYIKTLKMRGITPELLPFITVWTTDSSDNTITIPVDTNYTYNYTVDWGDGSIDENMTNSKAHTYNTIGEHNITISGDFPYLHVQVKDREKLKLVTQWGDIAWKDFKLSFAQCPNVDVNATDNPDLTNVNSLFFMFAYASNLKGNEYFNDWDVSKVINMDGVFMATYIFNQPLNNWNVSNVTDMNRMFRAADAFNQPLNDWNVSNVTNMESLFEYAMAFNQPLS
jgi:surface protein